MPEEFSFKEASVLKPEDTEVGLSLSALKRKLMAINDKGSEQKGEFLLDWEILDEIFPFRTKIDRSIRRSRLNDMRNVIDQEPMLMDVLKDAWRWSWDQIAVQNLVLAAFIMDDDYTWLKTVREIGLFPCSLGCFTERAKLLSDTIKTHKVLLPDRLKYVELATFTGYRNPPYPGFDLVKEARELAGSGQVKHELYPGEFRDTAKEVLRMTVTERPAVGFRDWLASLSWATAGASSIGKIEWSLEDEQGRFKARKNMVPFLYSVDDLYDMCMKRQEERDGSIVKSELGKIRLAVSNDIVSYLRASYVLHYIGNDYEQWKGSTLNEDLNKQTNRLLKIMNAIRGRFSLPFDFKGFDHQPTRDELADIEDIIYSHAWRCSAFDDELFIIIQLLKWSDAHAVLSARDKKGEFLFDVKGGLMSGKRLTSIIGNAWNTVISEMALNTLKRMGFDIHEVLSAIRGDDKVGVFDTWIEAWLMQQSYTYHKVEGGAGKFSIWPGRTEFLRQEISDRVRAYPARILPGLTQRKPWTSDPWSEDMVLKALKDVSDSVVRRGASRLRCDVFMSIQYSTWCRKNKLSMHWLELPIQKGGFGLLPWKGYLPDVALYRAQKPNIQSNIKTDWYESIYSEMSSKFIPNAPGGEEYSRDYFSSLVVSDDIPVIRKQMRDSWRTEVAKQTVRWTARSMITPIPTWNATLAAVSIHMVEDGVSHFIETTKDYSGAYKHLAGEWRDLQTVARYSKDRSIVRKWLEQHLMFRQSLQSLERHGLSRRDALSWLFGDSLVTSNTANPLVGEVLDKMVKYTLGDIHRVYWTEHNWSATLSHFTKICSEVLTSSAWYTTLYQW